MSAVPHCELTIRCIRGPSGGSIVIVEETSEEIGFDEAVECIYKDGWGIIRSIADGGAGVWLHAKMQVPVFTTQDWHVNHFCLRNVDMQYKMQTCNIVQTLQQW